MYNGGEQGGWETPRSSSDNSHSQTICPMWEEGAERTELAKTVHQCLLSQRYFWEAVSIITKCIYFAGSCTGFISCTETPAQLIVWASIPAAVLSLARVSLEHQTFPGMLPEAFSSVRVTAKLNGSSRSLVAIILKSVEEELAGSVRVPKRLNWYRSHGLASKNTYLNQDTFMSTLHTFKVSPMRSQNLRDVAWNESLLMKVSPLVIS